MPSLSAVSSATASSHTALLVMVAHVESAPSHVLPSEETILNRTVTVGAAVVGLPDGEAVVGAAVVGKAVGPAVVGMADGAAVVGLDVVGAAVGLQSQTHWSLELQLSVELAAVLK